MRTIGWFLLLCAFSVQAENLPQLRFEIAGKPLKTLTQAELTEQLKSHKISINDPQYHKLKHYQAFALHDLLRLGYGELWRGQDYNEIAFEALDGYEAVSALEKLQQPGGFMAFADLDAPGWEPVGREMANPGPYYLVWSGAQQTTQNAYPWPWQVAALNLIRFADQYPEVYPRGAAKNSPTYLGFLTFKERCVRCHAMNREGGKIGPDLNAPRNILDYRDAASVKAYIRQPSQFRYTQMPDHTDLSEGELDNLLVYFRFKQQANNAR